MEKTIDKKSNASARKDRKSTGLFKKVRDWLTSCKNMCKKITWPKPRAVVRNFLIVLTTSIVLTLIIWGLDYVFTTLFTAIISLLVS